MLSKILDIRHLGYFARLANFLMVPIMYVVSGTFREKPQRTHAWDVQRLAEDEARRLSQAQMVFHRADRGAIARPRRWSIGFHVTIWRGWRKYVVLSPNRNGGWYIGWVAHDKAGEVGISRILLSGPVRMLLGPNDVSFFGVNMSGFQIPICQIGEGRIGDRGPHSKVPLC